MFKILSLFLFLIFATNAQSKIQVKSTLHWMSNLGSVADCVIANPGFRSEVSAIQKFDYSKRTGVQVIEDLSRMKDVAISTYKTKNPFSKTIAYTYGGARTVYFNTRKNPRDKKEMVNTVIHESTHIVGYGHGDNSSKGKENSVPYKVGSIAEKFVGACP